MKDFCIIGSGISGATIANSLSKKYSLDVYDKARGVGGRSSNKKLNKNESFDHGVQYISPKSIQFKSFIKSLISKKILKKWRGRHVFLNIDKKEDKKHIKIIGKKGNNAISKYLLKNINCNFSSEVIKIANKKKVWEISFSDGSIKFYKSLILTCPFPQLKKLSKKYIKHSFINKRIKMDANITVMMTTKKSKLNVSSYFFNDKILGWAGNENSKMRFKSKNDLWTLQSTYLWANKEINKNRENNKLNTKTLIEQFFKLTGIKKNKVWEIYFSDGSKKLYKSLILTCPFPQLKKLSKKYIKHSFINQKIKMDANITVMMTTKKSKPNISSYFFNDKILGWAGNENSKMRFKSKNDLWTLQSTYLWANKKIDKNQENKKLNTKIMIEQFFKLTGIKKTKVLFSLNHGWKYSSNSKPLSVKSYWNSSLKLGVCADWFVGPRLESGWISAQDLFNKINK